ncbi:MAG: ferredoxin family protein [Synergistaceae bacterium]|nr:ferredoxin family protein [Synergistaceae bacterium]
MSVEILRDRCRGCGLCSQVCPGGLIEVCDGRAYIAKPQNCWGCASCLKECPEGALRLYLGEDIGGLGGRLWVRRDGVLLRWHIAMPDGSVKVLTVDSRDGNKY